MLIYVYSLLLSVCETCYLVLKKERRLAVFKGSVLRKMFGPKGNRG
jgi:hypothetical protein